MCEENRCGSKDEAPTHKTTSTLSSRSGVVSALRLPLSLAEAGTPPCLHTLQLLYKTVQGVRGEPTYYSANHLQHDDKRVATHSIGVQT
mmetsp:Transcript_14322/g.33086  ORF Transcript_14322/g.33086 Transcript_14322/m.33086 type:complete len:89 (-) Transcript_14322:382-648(-)